VTAKAAPLIPVECSSGADVGSHILLDLYECQTEHLDDLAWVRETLLNAARAAHATIVETVFHQFAPWGISGVVVIAESHLAIHIWPERRYVAVDIFTCGSTLQIEAASSLLTDAFRSRRPMQRRFTRGGEVASEQTVHQFRVNARLGSGD
jgi:S-adenosylmethionine decarboxylase